MQQNNDRWADATDGSTESISRTTSGRWVVPGGSLAAPGLSQAIVSPEAVPRRLNGHQASSEPEQPPQAVDGMQAQAVTGQHLSATPSAPPSGANGRWMPDPTVQPHGRGPDSVSRNDRVDTSHVADGGDNGRSNGDATSGLNGPGDPRDGRPPTPPALPATDVGYPPNGANGNALSGTGMNGTMPTEAEFFGQPTYGDRGGYANGHMETDPAMSAGPSGSFDNGYNNDFPPQAYDDPPTGDYGRAVNGTDLGAAENPYGAESSYPVDTPYTANGPYGADSHRPVDSPYAAENPYGAESPYPVDAPYGAESPYPVDAPYGAESPYPVDAPYGAENPYVAENPYAAENGFDAAFDNPEPIDAIDTAGRNFDEEELETGMAARRNAIEWAVVLVAAVLLALVLRAVLLQAFFIPSPSMEDTLLVDDRVLVNKLSYRLNDISLGDIVVFHRTDAEIAASGPDDPKDVIKRVIATEGQQIEILDNQVLINGQQLEEPYLDPNVSMADFGPQLVPDGHIFVMGDNRNLSSDSRGETGPVSEERVVGRAFFLFWPLNRLSAL